MSLNYLIDSYTLDARMATKCKNYTIHDYELVKDEKKN